MQIRCHNCVKTEIGRYLFEINIEEYVGELEKLDIEQQTPIIIRIPCRYCKKIYNFKIYKDRYTVEEAKRFNK